MEICNFKPVPSGYFSRKLRGRGSVEAFGWNCFPLFSTVHTVGRDDYHNMVGFFLPLFFQQDDQQSANHLSLAAEKQGLSPKGQGFVFN
jgi:hypothetical protein